ncbi:hypothetical protein MKW94_027219, partial [Papaver nudicaule]|nr:hypothetical protein [Papaver nudicaule]
VGKSCVLLQFTDDGYEPIHNVTIGADFGAKMITLPLMIHRLKFGYGIPVALTRSYYRGASRAILVYDSTRHLIILKLSWLQEVRNSATTNMTIILIGNNKEEGERFAQKNSLLFTEVSAKTSEYVEEVISHTDFFLSYLSHVIVVYSLSHTCCCTHFHFH